MNIFRITVPGHINEPNWFPKLIFLLRCGLGIKVQKWQALKAAAESRNHSLTLSSYLFNWPGEGKRKKITEKVQMKKMQMDPLISRFSFNVDLFYLILSAIASVWKAMRRVPYPT